MTRPIVTLLLAGLLTLAGSTRVAQAQVAAPPPPPQAVVVQAPAGAALPTADALLTRYLDATGGVAAYDAIRNRVIHARLEILGAGIVLGVTAYSARPDSAYALVESEATGRIESGASDGVVWENSAMRGPIVKEGAERDDSLRDAVFDRMAHWKDHVTAAECTGAADVNGKPAYRVVLTPKVGAAQTLYFDQSSGLIVKSETIVNSSAGVVTVASEPSDYRRVDGVLIPFSSRMSVMGQQRALTIDKVEQNADLPADRFALPAEIKAIVKK
jgi:hypothetical protein